MTSSVLTLDRLRVNLSKLKPQTVRHVLGPLNGIIPISGRKAAMLGNYPFPIDAVKVDNRTTEDLTPDQLRSLLKAIAESMDIEAANIMYGLVYRHEARGSFKLKWADIDFWTGLSSRSAIPVSNVSQKNPLNDQARDVLKESPRN